jgi:hypothetical protein
LGADCGGVTFSEISGTATTDVTGRARISPTVTGTAETTGACTYELEIIYDGVIYVSPTTGTIEVT